MSDETLRRQLLRTNNVREMIARVRAAACANQFQLVPPSSSPDDGPTLSVDWDRLLLWGSVLAGGSDDESHTQALQIAHSCLLSTQTSTIQRDGAGVILHTLANRVNLDLAIQRQYISAQLGERLGTFNLFDWTRREIQHSVRFFRDQQFFLNQFQLSLVASLPRSSWLSVSAPTSAGKSFILREWICSRILSREFQSVVFVVPTRALIHETETAFQDALLANNREPSVSVTSLPFSDDDDDAATIRVFTQERLHLWLSHAKAIVPVDTVVIDEAHKLGDGARGILLQQALELLIAKSPRAKVVFSSPLTSNPSILLQDAPDDALPMVVENDSPTVTQNLLWASQVKRRPREWTLELCSDESSDLIGHFSLEHAPNPDSKRLPFVAHALGHELGANIIYANTPSDAEKYGKQLFALVGTAANIPSASPVNDLIELARAAIHPRYLLGLLLERRIAFHYGNMPLLLRSEIERLFREDEIKYLICTSTLVEGVNTACRSIFLRGPKKGRGRPMNEADFWNLAGRAGRWGQEFQGNIICVDPTKEFIWNNDTAPRSRAKYKINRAIDEVVSEPDPLIEYLRDGAPVNLHPHEMAIEYTAAYLTAYLLINNSLNSASWATHIDPGKLQTIETLIRDALATSKVDEAILSRHPGISVIAMNALREYFENREKDPVELLPASPSSDDALSSYIGVLLRIGRTMNRVFSSKQFVYFISLLSVKWMQGQPVSRIIRSYLKHLRRSNGGSANGINLQSEIRRVLENIERYARFFVPRYVACYCDVLRQFYLDHDYDDLADEVRDISSDLEFGVGSKTQLSLVALGASRTSAVYVSEIASETELDKREVVNWIKENMSLLRDLPAIVQKEIDRLIRIHD